MNDRNENTVLIYQDENGITKVTVRFSDDDIWLTQNQIAELYDTTQQNISQHIDGIYRDGELDREATNKKFLLVRQEGNRQVKRNIDHFNLDMINIRIKSLGFTPLTKEAVKMAKSISIRLTEDECKIIEKVMHDNQLNQSQREGMRRAVSIL